MIDKTAIVSPRATIADNAKIGAFSTINDNVVIGSNSIIDAHVHISSNVVIGDNVHIFSHANIGNGVCHVTIGHNTNIREFGHIGSMDGSTKDIIIGKVCYILAYSEINDNVVIEDKCILSNNAIINSGCKLLEGAIIGAKSSIVKDCTIGQGAMVGGVTNVTSNIPPYCMAEGQPHAAIRGLNIVGIKRNIASKESAREIKRAYMTLKKSAFSSTEAKMMLPDITDKYTKIFVGFIANNNTEQKQF